MPRASFQILVLPYQKRSNGGFEYAIFQRADLGYWQGIAGGGEDDESALAAAQREAWEEARIPVAAAYVQLATHCSVPIVAINQAARHHWPPNMYVIPKYAFAVNCSAIGIRLSTEHMAYAWLP